MSNILVIDDDDFFCDMLVQMLRQDGHRVIAKDDGVQALKLLERSLPDLIITDILMPHMDGVEFIMELSKQSNKTPVIAMSGGRRSVTAQFNLNSATLLGVKATLTKPFSQVELRQAIEQAMQ